MNIYWLEQTEAAVPAGNDWLGPNEKVCLNNLRFLKRRADWRLGRWTAKLALSTYLGLAKKGRAFPDIEILAAPTGAPQVYLAKHPAAASISISHRAGAAVCAVGPAYIELGCDLEVIEPRSDGFVADYFTVEEQALIDRTPLLDRPRLVALLWTGKESVFKALQTGLRVDTRSAIVRPEAVKMQSAGSASGVPAMDGWRPLSVSCVSNRTFRGWWKQAGNLLHTVVASPAAEPPISLPHSSQSVRPMIEDSNYRNESPDKVDPNFSIPRPAA